MIKVANNDFVDVQAYESFQRNSQEPPNKRQEIETP